jgi:hypothetical protein
MSAPLPAPQFQNRHFQQADPFDRVWQVEFRWMQTAISIRHADAVDLKFSLRNDEGEQEKVIALPHPLLLELARRSGHPLNDAWCLRLASAHLRGMIKSWADMDKQLVTLTAPELAAAAQLVKRVEAQLA